MKNGENNKEQAILEAAEKEFMQKGYEGARTVAIAEEAGVTHAMLHYYFRTKESLFDKILDEKIAGMSARILKMIGDENTDVKERIRNCVAAHFDFCRENPYIPKFIINEVLPHEERLKKVLGRVMGRVLFSFIEFNRQYEEAVVRGEIENVSLRNVMLDMASLNIFVFMAMPLVNEALGGKDVNLFLDQKREENIETIMRRITKK